MKSDRVAEVVSDKSRLFVKDGSRDRVEVSVTGLNDSVFFSDNVVV